MKHHTYYASGITCPGKAFLVLVVYLLCHSVRGNAQPDLHSYTVQKLSQDNGLSQGSNYFIHEDSRGFMWITAIDAINRYDGSTVKVYNLKRYFRNCPPLQQGYGFAEDEAGNIYVGSVNGLYVYHPDIDKFTLHHVFAGPDKLTMPFAYSNGYVWCFNKSYELATYCIANGKVAIEDKMPLPALESVHIYNTFKTTLYDRWPFMDKNGVIWVPGEQGLHAYDPKTKQRSYINFPSLHCSYYNAEIHAVMIGTQNSLLLYDIATNSIKQELDCKGMKVQLINSVCFNDKLAVFNTSRGLLALDRQTKQLEWLKHYSSKLNTSYALKTDKAGRVWACDDGLGMTVYDFNPPLLPKISSDHYPSSLIQTKGVTHFAELPDGSILTHRNILFDPKTRKLHKINLPVNPNTANLLISETDKDGAWLLFYVENQLSIFLLGKNSIKKIFTYGDVSNLGICHSLKTFGDGAMLLSFSKGLYWLRNGKLAKVLQQPDGSPFVINRLSRNKYAISYLNNDMWLVEKDANSLRFTNKILPGIQSFYAVEDSVRQKIWVATNQGIYLLDKDFHTTRIFDANTGLGGTYIYGILLDGQGNAWCSHQRGISSIDVKTMQIVNYDKSDGIQGWDYNNRAFYKAKDGTLYFGGVSGFNYFKPPVNPYTIYNPTVYIDEILVNNKIWRPDTNANLPGHLVLSHVQNNIVIKAAVKDLMYGAARRLIYRIKETDTTWKELSSRGAISLNSMAPGDYTLEMGIADKYKKLPVVQKTVLLSITAPFYLKSWFMVLLGIGLACIAIQAFRLVKNNRKKSMQRQRHALEAQRNKITADLHDDIGASLSSLQINSIVASRLVDVQPAQARKVLEQIAIQSKDLSVRMGDIIWSMKSADNAFISLSSRISNFASEMMGNTDIHYQVNIDKDADNRISDMTLRRNILLIVKEAINNMVKHSEASEISISLRLEKRVALLHISDNGKGFDANAVFQGNGLLNLKQRALEINAGIEIISIVGKGTNIILEIPVA